MHTDRQPAVYILTNRRNGTLYIGVTANLIERFWKHETKLAEGFSKRYNLNLLVYYDLHKTMPLAIAREKKLKEWRRAWKIALIESMNPTWQNLAPALTNPSLAESPGSRLSSG